LLLQIGERDITNVGDELLIDLSALLGNLHKSLHFVLAAHRNNHQAILGQLLQQRLGYLVSRSADMDGIEFYMFVKGPAKAAISLLYSYLLFQEVGVAFGDVLDGLLD
jgi:hypothetical protein